MKELNAKQLCEGLRKAGYEVVKQHGINSVKGLALIDDEISEEPMI